MKPTMALALAGVMMLAGCASRASNIQSSYVSPTMYQPMSCPALANEAQRVSAAAFEATGAQNRKAGKDAVAMTVGMVVFWPALFFVSGGDGVEANNLAQLKGQMDAIKASSDAKGCGIVFPEPEAATAPKTADGRPRMPGQR